MYKSSHRSISNYYTIHKNKVLGSGSTGTVYKGDEISTKKIVAIKVLDLEKIDNEVSEYLLRMEQNALLCIQHPNVLKGLDVFYESHYMYIITQFCNEGTLKDLIRKQTYLEQKRALNLFQNVLKGIICCSKKKILHRDIKPANIMLHDGIPKIIDFGYCEIGGFKKPTLEYNVGSPSYMAPQCYKFNMYNQKTEVWALGVTLFQLVTGRTLDQGRDMNDCFRQLIQMGINYPNWLSPDMKQLIGKCLQYDPRRRPTLLQLLLELQKKDRTKFSHSFLTKATSSTNVLRPVNSHNSLYYSPLSSKTGIFTKFTQKQNPSHTFKSIRQKCKIDSWKDRENIETQSLAIQDTYLTHTHKNIRQRFLSKLSDKLLKQAHNNNDKLGQGLKTSKKVQKIMHNVGKFGLPRQASMTFR